MKLRRLHHRPGYVALLTVTLVMTTTVMVGIAVTLLGANSLLESLLQSQGIQTYYVADSCAHEALIQLKRQGLGYVGSHTLTVGDDTCIITVENSGGTMADVTISADHAATTYRRIELTVDTADGSVVLWQEAD